MSEQTSAAPGVESEKDFGAPPNGVVRRWVAEIEAFERERKDWVKRAEAILKLYRREQKLETGAREFALLWANVEVLTPTLYARDPVPQVRRRFRDRDPVGRVAAQLLERVLSCQIEKGGDFSEAMQSAVQENLTVGQGVPWVFYEVERSDDYVADERVRLGTVHWRDFGFTAGARGWSEVTAVWRIAYMTREELRKRFGAIAKDVPLDWRPEKREGEVTAAEVIGKATVYEVWDSAERKVVWLHKGVDRPLDEADYPLRIRGKFPCPKPLFATLTTDNMVPIPDYKYYEDQALQLNDLTSRIAALGEALKMVGFVAGDAAPDIQKGLQSPANVAVVPVPQWAMAAGRPMDNAIAWLPVREVAETLFRLVELREQIKRDAYEVTGLSDILRGQTQASETATAQQIKAQWGSIRVRRRQADVQRVARDCLEIMADIICSHFDPERIAMEANAEAMPQEAQEHIPKALALLKGPDALRAYRIDVETDSTIEPDETAAREAATELLTGVTGYLSQTAPVLQGIAQLRPDALPQWSEMAKGLLVMAVRRFSGGDDAEEMIERAFDALSQPQQAPQGPQGPPPEQIAAEMEAQKAQLAAQTQKEIEVGKAQVALQMKQMELEATNAREAAKLEWEREKFGAEVGLRQAEQQATMGMERERMDRAEVSEARKVEAAKPEPDPRIDQLTEAVGGMAEMMQQAAQRLEEVAAEMSAPREIVRDAQGKAVGVRVNGKTRQIVRGADGRATGIN